MEVQQERTTTVNAFSSAMNKVLNTKEKLTDAEDEALKHASVCYSSHEVMVRAIKRAYIALSHAYQDSHAATALKHALELAGESV